MLLKCVQMEYCGVFSSFRSRLSRLHIVRTNKEWDNIHSKQNRGKFKKHWQKALPKSTDNYFPGHGNVTFGGVIFCSSVSVRCLCESHCIQGISCSVVANSSVMGQIPQASLGDWKTACSAPLPAGYFQLGLGTDKNLGKRRIYTLIYPSYIKWLKLEAAVSFGMTEIAPDDNIQGFSGNSQLHQVISITWFSM